MRRSLSLALVAAFVLAPVVAPRAAAPARAEDAPKPKKVENPEYKGWAQFAVGAFVELTMESEAVGMKNTSKMTHKLVELTAEQAVVETTMQVAGMPAAYAPKPSRRTIPKEIALPDVTPPKDLPNLPKPKEGEETIDVAGTQMKCKTFETTTEVSGMTVTSKTWITTSIPGGTAKMETRSEGKIGEQTMSSTMKTTVTKWAAK